VCAMINSDFGCWSIGAVYLMVLCGDVKT
jgi:hypothetical protein